MNPHQITADFETAIAEYAGAPSCVSCTSCTAALLLALMWYEHKRGRQSINLPKRTYVGVGMSVLNAGHDIEFRDEDWLGWYWLHPSPVIDSARWLSGGMFRTWGSNEPIFVCLSFHWAKTLSVSQAGCILHNAGPEADEFLRRARFDGRRAGVDPKNDVFDIRGQHCYLSPSVAAEGLTRLPLLPKVNMPIPNDDYPDLSLAPIFGGRR